MFKYIFLLVALFAITMAEPEPEAKPQFLSAYPYSLGYSGLGGYYGNYYGYPYGYSGYYGSPYFGRYFY